MTGIDRRRFRWFPAVAAVLAVAVVLAIVVPAALEATGRSEETQPERVEGIIRLVGSEPFPSLVLTDATGRDFHIPREDADSLRSRVGETVCLRGIVQEETLTTPDGKFTVRRYNLKDPVLCDN